MMKKLLVVLAVLVIAVPAVAGTWAPGYTWSAQQYGGVKFLNNYGSNETNAWGFGWEYSNPWGTQDPAVLAQAQYVDWVPDRTGQYQAQRDVHVSGGKSKWRSDTNWASLNSAGPGLAYTAGNALGVCLGWRIEGTPGSSYPAVYLRGATGGIQIGYTPTATTISGVSSNWKSNKTTTVIDGISGNWTQNLGDWSYMLVVYSNDNTTKRFDVYLNSMDNHMWGHATGDSGSYIQFGSLGSVSGMNVSYDYVAFGTGAANVGGLPVVPEPSSFAALLAGLSGSLVMFRRGRRS